MKNAKLFHGTSCTPQSYWLPYLKRELEKRGYIVHAPLLPDADAPDVNKWLPIALKQGIFDKDTVLVGHSAGAPLVLSVLEAMTQRIRMAILVAGYCRPNEKKEAILQSSYNWNKIKEHVKDIIFINSDNDPWGCTDDEGRYMFDRLGGTLIIKHGEGHMGSDVYHQPYKEFPLLVKLIE